MTDRDTSHDTSADQTSATSANGVGPESVAPGPELAEAQAPAPAEAPPAQDVASEATPDAAPETAPAEASETSETAAAEVPAATPAVPATPAAPPRAPAGTPIGGQWIDKGGGGGGISRGKGRSPSSKEPSSGGNDESDGPDSHMLDLAHAWWQTKNALDQTRRQIKELPKRIKRYHAQRNSRYGYLYKKNLAKAQEELETATELIPQLEAQLRNLKQEYHDAGYDGVGYSTFTPAETIVGGKGIEEVGHAVARGGTPRGLQSTGIEFEIASAVVAGPALLRLGKSLLGKAALRKAATRRALGTQVAELPARQRASLGRSTLKNYRKTFFDAHPDRQGKVIVHHGIEQRVLKKYPGVLTESELHSLGNLRGIPKTANSEVHLKTIRKEWDAFYKQHPEQVTKEQLLEKATEIDNKYGHLFDPPIR